MSEFSRNLTELLKQNGKTQAKLAAELHVSQQTISRWARGENEPDFDYFIKICNLLDVSPNEMLGWDSEI